MLQRKRAPELETHRNSCSTCEAYRYEASSRLDHVCLLALMESQGSPFPLWQGVHSGPAETKPSCASSGNGSRSRTPLPSRLRMSLVNSRLPCRGGRPPAGSRERDVPESDLSPPTTRSESSRRISLSTLSLHDLILVPGLFLCSTCLCSRPGTISVSLRLPRLVLISFTFNFNPLRPLHLTVLSIRSRITTKRDGKDSVYRDDPSALSSILHFRNLRRPCLFSSAPLAHFSRTVPSPTC